MRAGVVAAAQPGVEDLAVRAEELGLHSFWVNDSPMVHGDPFVALTLCAKATSRIRLSIGVTSPVLRSVPATASALASLNALTPGRIICGAGTGTTARRTLGMRPATAAMLENFTAALEDLCAGRSTSYREGDRVRDIRFLHAGAHVNTVSPIEFVGPRWADRRPLASPDGAAPASSLSACWTRQPGTRCTTPAAAPPRARPATPTPKLWPMWVLGVADFNRRRHPAPHSRFL